MADRTSTFLPFDKLLNFPVVRKLHHFKCHSARSCNTWAKGGPIKDDKISYIWGKKAFGGKDD